MASEMLPGSESRAGSFGMSVSMSKPSPAISTTSRTGTPVNNGMASSTTARSTSALGDVDSTPTTSSGMANAGAGFTFGPAPPVEMPVPSSTDTTNLDVSNDGPASRRGSFTDTSDTEAVLEQPASAHAQIARAESRQSNSIGMSDHEGGEDDFMAAQKRGAGSRKGGGGGAENGKARGGSREREGRKRKDEGQEEEV